MTEGDRPCNHYKTADVATLISNNVDLRVSKITRDKEKHYVKIKRSNTRNA